MEVLLDVRGIVWLLMIQFIPTNNCGSPTGCTGNSMVVDSKGQFTLQFMNYSAIISILISL